MYLVQKQLERLRAAARPGKVAVLYGDRRTGKTTLLRELLKTEEEPYLLVSGEDITVQGYLGSQSVENSPPLSAATGCWWWMRPRKWHRSG